MELFLIGGGCSREKFHIHVEPFSITSYNNMIVLINMIKSPLHM